LLFVSLSPRSWRNTRSKKELGGGTILDLGVYTIQISQFVFRAEPVSIRATGRVNDEGIDVETDVELTYPNGGVAHFKTSALRELSNKATVRGSKASMTVSKMNDESSSH
jgi:dihydrodiol dehydrogenase / D-xylose 1-dehydrogenase (NADP)